MVAVAVNPRVVTPKGRGMPETTPTTSGVMVAGAPAVVAAATWKSTAARFDPWEAATLMVAGQEVKKMSPWTLTLKLHVAALPWVSAQR